MFYLVITFFTVVVFIVLLYAGVLLLGVTEFKLKKPPLPPIKNTSNAARDARQVDEFLASKYDEKIVVRNVHGRFHVSIAPDCPLPDEAILASLTSEFPRFVFRISRSLYDSAST